MTRSFCNVFWLRFLFRLYLSFNGIEIKSYNVIFRLATALFYIKSDELIFWLVAAHLLLLLHINFDHRIREAFLFDIDPDHFIWLGRRADNIDPDRFRWRGGWRRAARSRWRRLCDVDLDRLFGGWRARRRLLHVHEDLLFGGGLGFGRRRRFRALGAGRTARTRWLGRCRDRRGHLVRRGHLLRHDNWLWRGLSDVLGHDYGLRRGRLGRSRSSLHHHFPLLLGLLGCGWCGVDGAGLGLSRLASVATGSVGQVGLFRRDRLGVFGAFGTVVYIAPSEVTLVDKCDNRLVAIPTEHFYINLFLTYRLVSFDLHVVEIIE